MTSVTNMFRLHAWIIYHTMTMTSDMYKIMSMRHCGHINVVKTCQNAVCIHVGAAHLLENARLFLYLSSCVTCLASMGGSKIGSSTSDSFLYFFRFLSKERPQKSLLLDAYRHSWEA